MYISEFFDLGINFGFDGVEGLGSTVVLSGDGVEFVKRGGSQKADQEGSEEKGLHNNKKNDK